MSNQPPSSTLKTYARWGVGLAISAAGVWCLGAGLAMFWWNRDLHYLVAGTAVIGVGAVVAMGQLSQATRLLATRVVPAVVFLAATGAAIGIWTAGQRSGDLATLREELTSAQAVEPELPDVLPGALALGEMPHAAHVTHAATKPNTPRMDRTAKRAAAAGQATSAARASRLPTAPGVATPTAASDSGKTGPFRPASGHHSPELATAATY